MDEARFVAKDTVELSVFLNLISSIAEEGCAVVARTAYTTFVRETNDFSVGLATPDGTFFAYPRKAGVPTFIGLPLEDVIKGVPAWAPGDVLFTNDAYTTGGLVTHSPDLNMLAPVFIRDELVAFCWGFLHSADVGGAVPGSITPSNRDIFQEGIRIPPTKLYRAGKLNEELAAIIRANVRAPVQLWGDLGALMSSFHVCAGKLNAIFDKFGQARSKELIDECLSYSEAKTRSVIASIPSGTATFVDYLDNDLVSDFPVRIKLTLVLSGSSALFDFTGTDPQVLAALNLSTAGKKAHSWLTLGFLQYVFTADPEIPVNGGALRPLEVIAPPGTLVHAVKPASLGARLAAGIRVMDVTLGALSQLAPDKVPAAGSGQGMLPVVAMPSLADGGMKVNILQPLVGGTGGRPGLDGYDGTDYSLSFLKNTPIEIIESELDVLVHSYYYVQDSGGPGEYRGGLGVGMRFEALLPDTTLAMRGMERTRFAPWGFNGGGPGSLTRPGVVNGGKPNERAHARVDFLRLESGETLELVSSGGGGYGNPLSRDPERVANDVRFGFVSRDAAENVYGVVLKGDLAEVDLEATHLRRDQIKLVGGEGSSRFGFGEFRAQWEAIWGDEAYTELNHALSSLPIHARVYAKGMIMRQAMCASPKQALTKDDIRVAWNAVQRQVRFAPRTQQS
jgi:N-methylhydantoinase B